MKIMSQSKAGIKEMMMRNISKYDTENPGKITQGVTL